MQVPVAGGPEVELLSGLTTFWWSVGDEGGLFIAREPEFDAIDRTASWTRKWAGWDVSLSELLRSMRN